MVPFIQQTEPVTFPGSRNLVPECWSACTHNSNRKVYQKSSYRKNNVQQFSRDCGESLCGKPEPSFDTLKSAQKKKRSFPKKCYNSSKSAHVQTAGSPSILATYIDTITLCLRSRYLDPPQPTSFAAAASKSSNSLGWAELDT